MVTLDAAGKPSSVRYHVLPSMLLNEMQKQERTNREQQRTIETLLARVGKLEKRPGEALGARQ